MAFIESTDRSLDRWEHEGHEYAIAVDQDPLCPAGDWGTGNNAARRVGQDWRGNTSVVDSPGAVVATTHYSGGTFEAIATGDSSLSAEEEATLVVDAYAHWAEGDVYMIARDEHIVGGYYTADGLQPSREEVQNAF